MTEYGIARNTRNLADPAGMICSGLTKEAAEDWMLSHLARAVKLNSVSLAGKSVIGTWPKTPISKHCSTYQ